MARTPNRNIDWLSLPRRESKNPGIVKRHYFKGDNSCWTFQKKERSPKYVVCWGSQYAGAAHQDLMAREIR